MRKFRTLQVCEAMKLAEQLNKLEEEGMSIFQVLYAIDLSEVGTSHIYTVIYYSEPLDQQKWGSGLTKEEAADLRRS